MPLSNTATYPVKFSSPRSSSGPSCTWRWFWHRAELSPPLPHCAGGSHLPLRLCLHVNMETQVTARKQTPLDEMKTTTFPWLSFLSCWDLSSRGKAVVLSVWWNKMNLSLLQFWETIWIFWVSIAGTELHNPAAVATAIKAHQCIRSYVNDYI